MFEQYQFSPAFGKFGHLAIRLIQVTEDQRPRGTGLYTSRNNLAVPEIPPLYESCFLGPPDTLHAECTFFHHARAAHGYVRIELLM